MKQEYEVKNQGCQMVKAPKTPKTNQGKTIRHTGGDLRTGTGNVKK